MTAPLALLHGFTGSPDGFRDLLGALEPRPAVVTAPALVGHGAADDASVTGFESEVDRLARVLRASATPCHLVGYSLGGRLALGLLVRHPALFVSATLIGAQPGLPTDAARVERRAADERWCDLLEQRGLEAFVAEWEALPLFATQARLPTAVLARQRAERLGQDPRGLVRSLRLTGLGVMPSYEDALGGITVPVTLVAGEDDHKFSALARQMAARMPRARVELVPGAGHNVVLERAEALARLLSRAINGPR
jgi:2-succinyl-6-hydroxy-2,4-cyclohexadiene-1-carboxylate synthase